MQETNEWFSSGTYIDVPIQRYFLESYTWYCIRGFIRTRWYVGKYKYYIVCTAAVLYSFYTRVCSKTVFVLNVCISIYCDVHSRIYAILCMAACITAIAIYTSPVYCANLLFNSAVTVPYIIGMSVCAFERGIVGDSRNLLLFFCDINVEYNLYQ